MKKYLINVYLTIEFIFIVASLNIELVKYKNIENCVQEEYFDSELLACVKCDTSKNHVPSKDKLSCVCNKYSRKVLTPTGFSSSHSGGILQRCERCPNGTIVSEDKLFCNNCSNVQEMDDKLVCNDCRPNEIFVDKLINGSRNHNANKCILCSNNTIALKDHCQECPLINRQWSTCACYENYELVNNVCVMENMLTDWPDSLETYQVELGLNNQWKFESYLLKKYLRSSIFLCQTKNSTACQFVANLCALVQFRDYKSSPCRLFLNNAATTLTNLASNLPWVYYSDRDPNMIISQKKINAVFTVKPSLMTSWLNITAIIYNYDGNFKKLEQLSVQDLNLCPSAAEMPKNQFQFGVNFNHECHVYLKSLLKNKETTEFFVPFIKYLENNVEYLYAIPVFIKNGDGKILDMDEESPINHYLVRRYFLIDNILALDNKWNVKMIQYAKSFEIVVNGRAKSEKGKIYPPYFMIEYDYVPAEDINDDYKVNVQFSIRFEMENKNTHIIEITMTILFSLIALYSGLETWSYSRRDGKTSLDLLILLKFLVCLSSKLSGCFFIVAIILSVVTFVFYKGQSVVYTLLPDAKLESLIIYFMIIAFVLKLVDLIYFIIEIVNIDIFLIDWERRRAMDLSVSSSQTTVQSPTHVGTGAQSQQISIWRTYFIANQWSELQTVRKINLYIHLIIVGYLLEIYGLKNWASTQMELDKNWDSTACNKMASINTTLLIAVGVLVYLFVHVCQVIFMISFYERFIKNRLQQLVDICSIASISIFILKLNRYGFYVHGRSVHGFADTDMATMLSHLQREENNLCGRRGLIPESDQQTFQMFITNSLRSYFSKLIGIYTASNETANKIQNKIEENDLKSNTAYENVNKFLSAFFQHALKDLDFEVRERTLTESLLKMEFNDNENDKAILYYDNGHSFDEVLFYGNESKLLKFDLFLFIFIIICTHNYLAAIISVALSFKIYSMVCNIFGKRNLARKTLIDKRFLV